LKTLPQHNCPDHIAIRIRKFGSGSHFVNQCLECGSQIGSPLSKKGIDNPSNIPPFDNEIADRHGYKIRELNLKLKSLYHHKQSLLLDAGIIRSNEPFISQATRSAQELKRNYDDLVDRFGFEAVHKHYVTNLKSIDSNRPKNSEDWGIVNEGGLKSWFDDSFKQNFEIHPEVTGRNIVTGNTVRVDFLCKAKPHLIKLGFDDSYFGVEVKYISVQKGFTHKTSRAFWQTATYKQSEFEMGGESYTPKFCLLFTNLGFSHVFDQLRVVGQVINDKLEYRGMLSVINHSGVGVLNINGNPNSIRAWDIRLAGNSYFNYSTSKGLRKGANGDNLIDKQYTGNF